MDFYSILAHTVTEPVGDGILHKVFYEGEHFGFAPRKDPSIQSRSVTGGKICMAQGL